MKNHIFIFSDVSNSNNNISGEVKFYKQATQNGGMMFGGYISINVRGFFATPPRFKLHHVCQITLSKFRQSFMDKFFSTLLHLLYLSPPILTSHEFNSCWHPIKKHPLAVVAYTSADFGLTHLLNRLNHNTTTATYRPQQQHNHTYSLPTSFLGIAHHQPECQSAPSSFDDNATV